MLLAASIIEAAVAATAAAHGAVSISSQPPLPPPPLEERAHLTSVSLAQRYLCLALPSLVSCAQVQPVLERLLQACVSLQQPPQEATLALQQRCVRLSTLQQAGFTSVVGICLAMARHSPPLRSLLSARAYGTADGNWTCCSCCAGCSCVWPLRSRDSSGGSRRAIASHPKTGLRISRFVDVLAGKQTCTRAQTSIAIDSCSSEDLN
jgi:hypothetical protein